MSNSAKIRSSAARARLLASVSGIALMASVAASDPAIAQDAPIRVEFGWHADQIHDSGNGFALPLNDLIPVSGITAPLIETFNRTSQGADGKITFRPDDSDWLFSASIRYGRAHIKGKISQVEHLPTTSFTDFHTSIPTYPFPYHRTYVVPVQQTANRIDAQTVLSESHYILDFAAGKDVGLGIFGQGSTSVLSAGVRFANFTSGMKVMQFHAKEDVHISYTQRVQQTNAFFPSSTRVVPWYRTYGRQKWLQLSGGPSSSHDFIGLGPALSWEASAPLWGDPDRSGISLDWSVNAAVLFGKQKNKTTQKTAIAHECAGYCRYGSNYNSQVSHTTRSSKNVTVPNVGGSVALSYRLDNFKADFGYRADYFFHAIDMGPGAGQVTRGFRGPYASISIAVGD